MHLFRERERERERETPKVRKTNPLFSVNKKIGDIQPF